MYGVLALEGDNLADLVVLPWWSFRVRKPGDERSTGEGRTDSEGRIVFGVEGE